METVLVVGSSGNIGVSAIIGALRTNRKVLAVVRNSASAEKCLRYVEEAGGEVKEKASSYITFANADVTKEDGVQSVVEKVKDGRLPAFQHVYATVGILEPKTPMWEVDTAMFHRAMNIGFEANFFAYRATMPYLIEQNNPNSSWTVCTGAGGEYGVYGVTGISQGALFVMATAASRETATTNVRFNEAYLAFRVEVDSEAEKHSGKGAGPWDSVTKASDYARHYEKLLDSPDVKGCRVYFEKMEDVETLRYKKKVQ